MVNHCRGCASSAGAAARAPACIASPGLHGKPRPALRAPACATQARSCVSGSPACTVTTVDCPRCSAPMTSQTLDGHHGRRVTIDLCHPCHVLWFDTRESVSLSPGATLALFRTIGDGMDRHRPARSGADPAGQRCPRCRMLLTRTHDMQRGVRFQYLNCPDGHGRLTSFFDFLREKNFIRPLTAAQLAELRDHVQTVNCSSCGAPIDLAHSSTCGHCGSPLSMLDMRQAGALVAQLQQADGRTRQGVDPSLPLQLERARRDVEAAFATFEHERSWFSHAPSEGLVWAGLSALARWMKNT